MSSKIGKIFLVIILIMLVLILIIGCNYMFYRKIKLNELKVILNNNLEVEINTEVKKTQFIKSVENGIIIDDEDYIDTKTLGNKTITIQFKNNYNKITEYQFLVNVVDTIPPEIIAKKELTTFVGKSINLLENVVVEDNSLETINIEIVGEYDFNKIGDYELKYLAKDSSHNVSEYEFALKVVKDPNNYEFKTKNGYTGKVINGITYIDNILIVNKTYSLTSDYGSGITSKTNEAFKKMKNAAAEEDLKLYISSGFRSYNKQKKLYNNYVKRDGKDKADTYSARAGHSEHQSGLAFDLNIVNDSFIDTKEAKWINENCYKYGFIIRYPKDKQDITGYKYEPWHLRYVGTELASKLYNDGNWITLEEYYGISSSYN